MLQNMLQLAMSGVDEIESQCAPELYPVCRKTKDYIRETSMLIGANVSIWPQIVKIEEDRENNEVKGEAEKPDQTLQQVPGNRAAGVGQLEKVGRLRYLKHLIWKTRGKK